MPGVANSIRAIVASIAVISSLALAGPASAAGPLSGLTDTVTNVTTGLGQTVESVGGTVETVTGGAAPTAAAEADQAEDTAPVAPAEPTAAPEDRAEPAAAPEPENTRSSETPAPVAPVQVVGRVVGAVVKTAAATTTTLGSAASKTAEPVLGAALGDERAGPGSAVAAPVLDAVADISHDLLGTVARVTEPVLPLTGPVLRSVGETISTTTQIVASVEQQVLTPPGSQSAPPPSSGTDGGSGQGPVAPAPVSPPQTGFEPAPGAGAARSKGAKGPRPTALGGDRAAPLALEPELSSPPPVPHLGARTRAEVVQGGGQGLSPAPTVRPGAPAAASSAAGGSAGFASAGFAVPAGLFVLAAPALGRRLKLWPALVRPLAFVSPPERPG